MQTKSRCAYRDRRATRLQPGPSRRHRRPCHPSRERQRFGRPVRGRCGGAGHRATRGVPRRPRRCGSVGFCCGGEAPIEDGACRVDERAVARRRQVLSPLRYRGQATFERHATERIGRRVRGRGHMERGEESAQSRSLRPDERGSFGGAPVIPGDHTPWPRKVHAGPTSDDWRGHRQRQVRSKRGQPALLVRMEADGDGTPGNPHGEGLAEPPDHVVPSACHTGQRQVGQVGSPVVKETSDEGLVDLDLGARRTRHPGSVSQLAPNPPIPDKTAANRPCAVPSQRIDGSLASIFRDLAVVAWGIRLGLIFGVWPCLAARLSRWVGGVPRALVVLLPGRGCCCGWSAGWQGLQAGGCGGELGSPGPALDEAGWITARRPAVMRAEESMRSAAVPRRSRSSARPAGARCWVLKGTPYRAGFCAARLLSGSGRWYGRWPLACEGDRR